MRFSLVVMAVLAAIVALAGCETMADETMADETMMESDGSMNEMKQSDKIEFEVTIEVLSGSPSPIAPVAWAVHEGSNPFVAGEMGKLAGLEALAEDGDPSGIGDGLGRLSKVKHHGVAAVPSGSSSAGPATPGSSYSFTLSAGEGQRLSFATMYVQSNDLFYSPGPNGLALFDMSSPIDGAVTRHVVLYDAGTEVNEAPGGGANQAPRQSGPDTGPAENNPVRPISDVDDGFSYPEVDVVLRVTVQHNESMSM
jgi:hypothetical protein